jgi:hypothetical protein
MREDISNQQICKFSAPKFWAFKHLRASIAASAAEYLI